MCRNRVFGRLRALAAAGLALTTLAVGCQAAELPSQVKTVKPPEAAAAKKCNIGGLVGVVAANGVCVRLSGSVSAVFGGGQLK
jgi:hypothetical protein